MTTQRSLAPGKQPFLPPMMTVSAVDGGAAEVEDLAKHPGGKP